jgi:hypothetical protein
MTSDINARGIPRWKDKYVATSVPEAIHLIAALGLFACVAPNGLDTLGCTLVLPIPALLFGRGLLKKRTATILHILVSVLCIALFTVLVVLEAGMDSGDTIAGVDARKTLPAVLLIVAIGTFRLLRPRPLSLQVTVSQALCAGIAVAGTAFLPHFADWWFIAAIPIPRVLAARSIIPYRAVFPAQAFILICCLATSLDLDRLLWVFQMKFVIAGLVVILGLVLAAHKEKNISATAGAGDLPAFPVETGTIRAEDIKAARP